MSATFQFSRLKALLVANENSSLKVVQANDGAFIIGQADPVLEDVVKTTMYAPFFFLDIKRMGSQYGGAMNRMKEVAKFACGAEAFHTFIHVYFWLSNTTVHVFGLFAETSTWHVWGAIVNAVVCIFLGIYAWGPYGRRSV